jgi:hypothetical protein
MTLSAGSPKRVPALSRPWHPGLAGRLAALTPLWAQIIGTAAWPTYFPAMVREPPDIVGIPLGVAMEGIALIWMLLGTAVVWNARTQSTGLLGLLFFTTPATILAVFTPALVLLLQNAA